MSHPSPFKYLMSRRREERAEFWRDAAREFRRDLRNIEVAWACEQRALDCEQAFEHYTHARYIDL